MLTAAIKKYQSIIKKKKKDDKIVLSAKTKLNSIEVLISKALIDLNIGHDEFILVNNVLKEYDDMKKEIKNLKTWHFIKNFNSFIKQCYFIDLSAEITALQADCFRIKKKYIISCNHIVIVIFHLYFTKWAT